MVRAITEREIATYREQGVVKLPGLVGQTMVDQMLEVMEQQMADPSEWVLTGTHFSDRCFGLSKPLLRDYLLDPVMGENAARAMGSRTARFYFDHVFIFEPQSPLDDHYWHQDVPYWPVEGEEIVSFWLSLVACTPETSALKFVPGTHRAGRLYRPKGFDGEPLSDGVSNEVPNDVIAERVALAVDGSTTFVDEPAPAFHENPDVHGVVQFSYEPGDAVMFHSRVVHSSGGNNSPDQRRVAYSTRFIGDDVRFMLRKGVFQDPALLPEDDEPFGVGAPLRSRRWPVVHG
jgi:ectoine hydroxylase-related dioxygenase (phytanoyl-CoA dioxygenase family)